MFFFLDLCNSFLYLTKVKVKTQREREREREEKDLRVMKKKTLKRNTGSSSTRAEKSKMKGNIGARRLTVQLGQVSLFPLHHHHHHKSSSSSSSSSSVYATRFQNRLEEEKKACPSSVTLDFDLDTIVDDKDCILSQDFFCTPDYITPDAPQISNILDWDKENFLCPKSPEKLNTSRSKRRRPEGFPLNSISSNLPCHEEATEFELDAFGSDDLIQRPFKSVSENCNYGSHPAMELALDTLAPYELKTEKPFEVGSEKKPNFVSQSAVALRCRVMPPPCIQNPYVKDTGEIYVDRFGNQRSKSTGLFPTLGSGDGLSRYRTDFHELEQIGYGNFSRVFKVLKRIDGCMYAVKHSIRQLYQDTERRQALMEVQALAALGSHENIVGYYTSWFENEQLFIQMELCDCSLSIKKSSQLFTEEEVLEALHQIAKALKFIHERGIAHLDVKPDNIYVKNGIYKLGDFGCATLLDRSLPIEEGDARYMPQEILNDNYEHLDKVDIFSLGAAIYEVVRRSPLPASGPHFLNLREGKLPLLPGHSIHFQNLVKAMVDPDPVRRPSAKELVGHPIFDKARRKARPM